MAKELFSLLALQKNSRYFLRLAFLLGHWHFCHLSFCRTETNLLDSFFQQNSRVQQDFTWIDHHHGGSGSFDIVIGRENGWDFQKY